MAVGGYLYVFYKMCVSACVCVIKQKLSLRALNTYQSDDIQIIWWRELDASDGKCLYFPSCIHVCWFKIYANRGLVLYETSILIASNFCIRYLFSYASFPLSLNNYVIYYFMGQIFVEKFWRIWRIFWKLAKIYPREVFCTCKLRWLIVAKFFQAAISWKFVLANIFALANSRWLIVAKFRAAISRK